MEPGTQLLFPSRQVAFECLEKFEIGTEKIKWVTCSEKCASNGGTPFSLQVGNTSFQVEAIKFYPRMDIIDMRQKWHSLNNLWNRITSRKDVWTQDSILPDLNNPPFQMAPHLPFDNYGGNMGIQTKQTNNYMKKYQMNKKAIISKFFHQLL